MENTLENKARFFAQYFGQKVGREYNSKKDDGFERNYPINNLTIDSIKSDFLELKSLSDITDEDAIEFFDLTSTLRYSGNDQKINHVQIELEYNTFVCVDLKGIDFLRSKGYALPFNNLSVEQQIEYNWVKLT